MRKKSICIAKWKVFEKKGKRAKVKTLMVIGIEIGAVNEMEIRSARMTIKRKASDIFHWESEIPSLK